MRDTKRQNFKEWLRFILLGKAAMNIPPGIYRIVSKKAVVSYRVRIRIKGHPPISKNFKTLTHAKKWKRITECAVEKDEYFSSLRKNTYTLSEAIKKYLEETFPIRQAKVKDLKQHLERWEKELGKTNLEKLSSVQIATVRDKLLKEKTTKNKNRSPATVVRYLASLSILCSIAVKEWGWIKENPVLKVSKPKEPKGRTRYLSKEEIKALLTSCKNSENSYLFAIVSIALQTGMRRGEILSLTWEDVDFTHQAAHLRDTKNGSSRTVPLNSELMNLLEKLSIKKRKSSLVFPSPNNSNKPMHFRSAWEAVLKRANITDFSFHDLRHTAASYLAMAGCGYGQIGEILGHKSSQVTKRYIHLSLESKKETVQILEDLCAM